MGVINLTPNSFSDGGELSPSNFKKKLESLGPIDALDLGAESTAPMNQSISWKEEWARLEPYLPLIGHFKGALSFDTYHPETIEEIVRYYVDHRWFQDLFWNDVSGKFDGFVYDFLSMSENFHYILCHNLCPTRALTGRHMDYVDPDLTLEKVAAFYSAFRIPRIIFDPCLGFSKNYEQNWQILNRFDELQKLTGHDRWLLGFSRKSFLQRKYNLSLEKKEELDLAHVDVLSHLKASGEVWIRAHRPHLVPAD